MSIADEPDDTPGASNRATPPAGQGGDAQPDGGGGDDDTAGRNTLSVAHPDQVWWLPYAVGFLVLAGYALFLTRMVSNVTVETQTHWDRYLYLFGSVEALAFTAAGFFFGREVNRGRAEAAETQARQQANRAAKAEKKEAQATANGQAIGKTLEVLADGAVPDSAAGAPQGMAPQGFGPAAMAPAVVPAAQLRGLANLAREMFPRR